MVTYKLILDQRRIKSNGKYPINIRVTYDRKTCNYYTGVSVEQSQWDFDTNLINKLCLGYKNLNKTITSKFLNVQKQILDLEEANKFSFQRLSRVLSDGITKKENVTFREFANKIIRQLKETNRIGNAIVYTTGVQRLLKYAGREDLTFEDIDFVLINNFTGELKKEGIKTNSVGNYLRTIRAIFNLAIKSKVVSRSLYPFSEISIKTERTAKRAITVKDIKKIFEASYKPNTAKWYARNYFMLSFCLRGMSFTDLAYLTNDNIKNGRIIYKRRKTGSQLNIRLEVLANEIIQLFSDRNTKYLMPILPENIVEDSLNSKAIIYQWIKTTNKWLRRIAEDCSIEADITTYVTRHSWATIAKSLGYSNELIAEGLGHEYGNKITNIYLDSFDQSVIDEVNARILNHLA